MSGDLLQTKLYVPRLRPSFISRPQLSETLNVGLQAGCKLTLISAPAGFGKTTLVTEWLAGCARPSAWLSLDERDSDLPRFLTYLIAALQTLFPAIGKDVTAVLQAAPPPIESSLTTLLNEIGSVSDNFLLVLDDYHMVDAPDVDNALAFLLNHLPPQMHLVITTREDPNLPLARLRVRGQLTELRAADLRFSLDETAVFLNQMMGLTISKQDIAALEARTEGWIAGLQLAALSMQGHPDDSASFIHTFSGSHRFVLDYLVEEVLQQQPESVQRFLLQTAVLNQMTGPLCDALTGKDNSQAILESLERANLFLVPLDNDRRWYRYHHLFADLLRQRLHQRTAASDIADLNIQASQWYEANGLELEAFHHAAAAHDIERAARLIEGEGLPLYFRGEATAVRHWLASLSEAEFKARPALWVTYASVLTMTGRLHDNIEEILQAAEAALPDPALDDKTADLHGQIAANRAMLGIVKNDVESIITQSQRALKLLHPDNAPMRTTTTWTLGYAYQIQGKRAAAKAAYAETIAQSQKTGNIMNEIAATTCVGQIREADNEAHQAAETFERILKMMGDPPWPAACEACVGLARIHYQWNDLETAEQYGLQGLELARQLENVDTPAACGVLLARVKLAQGEAAGALAALAETERFVRQHHFDHWVGAITAVRIQTFLQQGNLTAAAQLAETHNLPLSLARVKLAQGDPTAALAALEPARQQAEANNWADERLQVLVLLTLAYDMAGDMETAVKCLSEALALAAPGGLVRLFVDEGPPMAALLQEAGRRGMAPVFAQQVLEAFGATAVAPPPTAQPLPDPLSERELEVLKLLATSLTGPEIARELMISLNTMRTHTRNIYSKLGVNSRLTAVRRTEELNLL
ncbi:MAG: LuxR family transcriptional regulator [Chloroflexi bacterium]|nr:LuxR family transcriptional regulator [Chloroflexota bacterium]MBK7180319.1 LuxR family transcriptional regulator [Chloroflexota bacterium]MBP6804288.1 LuxR family transcriptional regulator [Chloroflexota bacterium]